MHLRFGFLLHKSVDSLAGYVNCFNQVELRPSQQVLHILIHALPSWPSWDTKYESTLLG